MLPLNRREEVSEAVGTPAGRVSAVVGEAEAQARRPGGRRQGQGRAPAGGAHMEAAASARPAEAAGSAAVTGGRSLWPPLSRTGPRRDRGARTPGRPPSLSPCTRGRPGGNRLSGCPDVTSFLPCAAKNRPALLAGDGGGSSEFYKNLGEAADAPSGGLVPRVSEPLDSRSVVLRCPVPVRRWPDRRGGAHRPAAAGALPDAGQVAGASVQTAAPPVPLPLSVACDVASPFSGSCVALRSVRS